jgi:hypothetical protein
LYLFFPLVLPLAFVFGFFVEDEDIVLDLVLDVDAVLDPVLDLEVVVAVDEVVDMLGNKSILFFESS